jgi:hypothetical protein
VALRRIETHTVTDFQAYAGIICKLTNCPELSGVVQVENDAVVALTLKIPGLNFDHYFDHPFAL